MIREVYKKVKRNKEKSIFNNIKDESLKLAAHTNKREWKIKDEHLKEYIEKGHIEYDDEYIYFHTTFSTDDANVVATSHFNLKVARMKRIFQILNHPRDAQEAIFFDNVLNFLINNGITRDSTMEQLWKAVESGSGSKGIFWEFEHYVLHERGYVIPRTSKEKSKKASKPKGQGKTSSKGKKSLKSAKKGVKSSKSKDGNKESSYNKDKAREYYLKNKDKILAKQRERYKNKKDDEKRASKYDKDKARAYYLRNREKILAAQREKNKGKKAPYETFKKSKQTSGVGSLNHDRNKSASNANYKPVERKKLYRDVDNEYRRKRKRRKGLSTRLEEQSIRKPKIKKKTKQGR